MTLQESAGLGAVWGLSPLPEFGAEEREGGLHGNSNMALHPMQMNAPVAPLNTYNLPRQAKPAVLLDMNP
jgi:hypothetical protein